MFGYISTLLEVDVGFLGRFWIKVAVSKVEVLLDVTPVLVIPVYCLYIRIKYISTLQFMLDLNTESNPINLQLVISRSLSYCALDLN